MILYFSATGNSRYVAALLARELGGQPVMDMSPYMRPGAERLTVTLTGGERLLFTTENPREVDRVADAWRHGAAFDPGQHTRGLYARGVE